MNIEFESRLEKDLRHIKDRKLLGKIKEVVLECREAENLGQIGNLKKLQGHDSFYRIKIGDYRLGFELVETTLIFTRILHRKDVYRYFP